MKNIQFNRVSPKPNTEHRTPNTEHRTPNTEHYRFRSINTGLLLFVQVVWLSLSTAIPSTAQCPVASVLSMDPTFVSLRICDIAFPINISFFNDSGTDHDYFIEIYSPFELRLEPPVAGLSNFQETLSPSGDNVVYTGTFNVPLFYPGGNAATLSLPFSRLGTWSGKEFILVTVYDADCPGTPVLLSQSVLIDFAEPHTDLRAFPETKISELLNLGVIPSPCSPPTTPQFLIDDVLDFNLPYCITGGIGAPHRLVLLPGARIDISSSVIFDLVEVSTCPGSTLGEGIRVKPYGSLDVISSSIEDCRIGINAEPESFLSVSNTFFQNNYVGLNLDMRDAPLAGTKRLYALSLSGNTFTAALDGTPLKAPYPGMPEAVETRGYAGIRLYDYMDFNVWQRNTFNRLANGLVAFNSTLNIGDFQFDDMNSVGALAYESEGYGIHLRSKGGASWANINEPWLPVMTFNNCKTGIRANAYAGRIENCTMTNVNTGIWWENSRNRDVRIFNDTITARNVGVRSFGNEPLASFSGKISQIADNIIGITGLGSVGTSGRFAIQLDELGLGNFTQATGGWLVADNTIGMVRGGQGIRYLNGNFGALQANTVNNADPSLAYKGIETQGVGFSTVALNDVTQTLATGNAESYGVYSDGGFANRYDCNCLDNTGVGMQFFDLGDFTDGVRGNNFNTHNNTGLRLGTLQAGDAFIGTQNHTGNVWDLSAIPSGQNGGENWGSNFFVVDQSRFTVHPTQNGGRYNPPVSPQDWFSQNELGVTYSCANQCAAPNLERPPFAGETATPTTLDQAIINGTFTTTSFEAPMEWKAAYRVYRKMLRQPGLVQTSALATAFKLQHDNQSTGKLAWVEEERTGLFALTGEQDSLLGIYAADVDTVSAQLLDLDEQIQEGDSVSQTTYTALVTQRGTTQVQLEQFWAGMKQTRDQQIQNLLNYNSGITTSLTIDGNHKSVNDIVLRFFATDTLATGDLSVLETIAAQCPLEGGDAVYEARAMVSYFTGEQFDNSACIGGGEREGISAPISAVTKITIYPNPATNMVIVQGAPENAIVNITDHLGRLVHTGKLQMNRIELTLLQSGVYTVQVLSSENTLLTTQKLVVAK